MSFIIKLSKLAPNSFRDYQIIKLAPLIFICFSCHNRPNKSSNQSSGKDTVAVDTIAIKIKFYTNKINANSKDADAYWNRGKWEATYVQNPTALNQALADLNKAVQLDSTNSNYYYNLANVDFITGKTHEARDAFVTCIRLNPKNTDAILKLAQLYLYVKQYSESMKLIQSALNIDPHIAEAYFMKGMIYLENNDSAKSISNFQSAVEEDPDYFDAYIQLGLMYARRGNRIALTYFNNALNLQPDNPEPYYDMGMFYQFNEQDYNGAISYYQQLLQVDSVYKNCWYNLGVIYLFNKIKYDSALLCFNKVIKEDSTFYLAYYGRANCYEQLHEKEKALNDFAHAFQINPNFEDAKISYNELKNKR